MVRTVRFRGAVLAASTFSALALVMTSPASADAVIYCKTVGVPKGCIARPVAPVAPVVVAPVVVAPRVAVPGVGAPGVGVAPGRVGNRGGPVNRVGRR